MTLIKRKIKDKEFYKNTALDIAKYILDNTPMSNLRLQKILYFIQGEHYKKYRRPAFEDTIASCSHGVMIPNVYYEFCAYGGCVINIPNQDIQIENNIKDIVDKVVDKYKSMYIWDLVYKTCCPGTPCYKIYNTLGNKANIPNNLIKDYFINGFC